MPDLPDAFKAKITTLIGGEEAEAFFQTYRHHRTAGLRANLLKITPDELAARVPFHLQPIPFCPDGFYYREADAPGRHPYHQAGLYYIQEPSAMFIAGVLAPRPHERVLDLCAAPGGKSTQLAAMMHHTGLLIANEPYPKRSKALSENIERMGITNAVVTNETPERLAHYFPGYFDKILVDAPCSGEGMFRKDPEAMQYWSPQHVAECAGLQRKILEAACHMLRAGGTLVYSTCTFSPEENEQIIEGFLERHPDLALLPIEKGHGIADGRPEWGKHRNPELTKTARLWPQRLSGEGHFAARLRKTAATSERRQPPASSAKENVLKDFRRFEQQALREKMTGMFRLNGNQLYLLPPGCPDLAGLKVIRAGLHLGELKKNRFEPNHALALALPAAAFQRQLPLTLADDRWRRYLHGETLPVDQSLAGWTAITIDGFPLGWGKAVGGILKNFYPKGLRR